MTEYCPIIYPRDDRVLCNYLPEYCPIIYLSDDRVLSHYLLLIFIPLFTWQSCPIIYLRDLTHYSPARWQSTVPLFTWEMMEHCPIVYLRESCPIIYLSDEGVLSHYLTERCQSIVPLFNWESCSIIYPRDLSHYSPEIWWNIVPLFTWEMPEYCPTWEFCRVVSVHHYITQWNHTFEGGWKRDFNLIHMMYNQNEKYLYLCKEKRKIN